LRRRIDPLPSAISVWPSGRDRRGDDVGLEQFAELPRGGASLPLVLVHAMASQPVGACGRLSVNRRPLLPDFKPTSFADYGISLPARDARDADRGNPRRFHRSAKWTKAMEGFVHGK